MIIICNDRLREISAAPACWFCGKENRTGMDPHHVFVKRGIGGGTRLDLTINLAPACRLPCHNLIEVNLDAHKKMQRIAASRHFASVDLLMRFLWFVSVIHDDIGLTEIPFRGDALALFKTIIWSEIEESRCS